MQPPCDVRALYQYASEHDDDLNFGVGQVIHVDNVEDDEWLNGSYTDTSGTKRQGIFPKNFVELVEAPKAPARPARAITQKGADNNQAVNARSTVAEDSKTVKHLSSTTPQVTDTEIPTSVTVSQMNATTSVQDLGEIPMSHDREEAAIPEHATVSSHDAERSDDVSRSVTQDHDSKPQTTLEPMNETSQPVERGPKLNAFRDRIAAFNKQGAAPVAPKPMVKPSLAKKPFVAPPPSKNSYVPLATSKARSSAAAETLPQDNSIPTASRTEISHESATPEEAPKLGSLKERIAALQAERSQLASKKSLDQDEALEPRNVDQVPVHEHNSPSTAEIVETGTIDHSRSVAIDTDNVAQNSETGIHMPAQMPIVPGPPQLNSPETPQSPLPLARQRTNNSIETLQTQPTGASGHSQASSQLPITVPTVPIVPEHDIHEHDSTGATSDPNYVSKNVSEEQVRTVASTQDISDAQSSEDEVDEEERRKQQLRERMAKMSGGMGMGMHMALGLGGSTGRSNHSTKAKNGKTPDSLQHDQSTESQAPIPMPGLPPLPRTTDRLDSGPDKSRHEPTGMYSTSAHEVANDELGGVQAKAAIPPIPSADDERHDSQAISTSLSNSVAQLSLESDELESSLAAPNTSTEGPPLSPPIRAAPPPIPGGRPVSIQIPSQPVIVSEPSHQIQRGPVPSSSISSFNDIHEAAPPASPSIARVTGPPPVPITTRQRSSIDSPSLSASSPQYTPGGSKRMSYFGAVPSRPSMDLDTRDSSDFARSSFDTVARTNSARNDAPARPPPPSVPSVRAPPPPVPSAGPPSRTPSMPPTRMVSIPEPSRSSSEQIVESTPLEAAIVHREPHSTLLSPAATEREREGYEADDDDTDVQSLNRQSTSGARPQLVEESTPQSTAALERSSTKKKGIKSLFKRKDK